MNDIDEMTSGPSAARGATAQQPAEAPDEFGGAAAAPAAQPTRVANGHPARAGEAQMVTAESKGDEYVSAETEAQPGAVAFTDYQDTGSTPSSEAFTEASIDQLERAAEAGEESAAGDLQEFGYAPIQRAESEAVAPLLEAGAVDSGQSSDAEFLPILAAVVPTLVSTIGPAVAKGVLKRLSPRARKHIGAIAKTAATVATARPPIAPTAAAATAAITAATRAGGRSGLIAMLAKLLASAAAKPGLESEMEAADPVVEQAAQVLEVIIGSDDRVRITPTTKLPWRFYCALSGEFPDGARYTGTAFRIGRNALGTAGHCVYSHSHGGWARRITVIAAADGDLKPYGVAQAVGFRSTAGWVNNRSAQADIGCVVLPQNAFGSRNLGHFGFGVWSTQELLALPAVVAGYAGDKPFAQFWGMSRKIKAASATTLVYEMDTYGGQSGAPVYIRRNGQRFVVGIHNYGAQSGNSATRVTQPIFALLQKWAAL